MSRTRPAAQYIAAGAAIAIALAVLAVLVLQLWVGAPSADQVRHAFLQENPDAVVRSVFVGEGDFSAAYFHIIFNRPGDPVEHEHVWLFLKVRQGPWRVEHKQVVR